MFYICTSEGTARTNETKIKNMTTKFDKNWKPPRKSRCEECKEQVYSLATIKTYGRTLCIDCYEQVLKTGI